ncbi:CHL4 domain-containing protein [Neofusicoccum parvum]|uniref:CHL4 domain-containing protein n=2 Tax=Neofusicoccum parvum TaxID=310453 RepID=A0ACB5S376_9PEZI|nr:putative chl4 family chromosome segregation protein [Neofusicoccum parvum UCRNP2]GME26851.1 CHL4 domain-containing protein [Neofusicoccum parvum]GME65375.1 CHL4 domain-containing protein [Neofusicoccum parvum]
MSRRTLSVPTNAALPHTQRMPATSPDVSKTLSRLSRQSLLELVLEWLDKKNRDYCQPFLARGPDDDEDGDAPYTAATSEEEVIEAYKELKARKGGKREVVDRILEGDWKHGITLYQLAMAETRYLLDHPNSLRWNALQLSKVTGSGGTSADDSVEVIDESAATSLPRFHATTFVLNLQKEVAPVTKAHYYITRVKAFGISLLRKEDDGKGLERLDVRMEDPFPPTSVQAEASEEPWTPDVHLSFQGSHVFAGVRQLVEQGIVDGEKMPGWMAGDAGVSVGVVKEGRVREKA